MTPAERPSPAEQLEMAAQPLPALRQTEVAADLAGVEPVHAEPQRVARLEQRERQAATANP